MPRRTDSLAARRAEIVGMLQRMPTRWRRAYNTARRTLADNGGPVLPTTPTPEQAMLILGNTAGGNRDTDRPTGDQKVPQGVRDEAMHGLRLSFSEDYPGWEFFGIARAIQLALAPGVPMRTRERMKRYLTAHEKDKAAPRFGDEENPSNGYMAWLNWGGDAGLAWNEDVARATYSSRTRGQRANPVSEDFKAGPAEDIEFSRALMSKVFVENPRRNPLTRRNNGFVDYMKGVEERGKKKGRAERAVGKAQTATAVVSVGAKAAPKVAAKVAAKVGAKVGAKAIPVVGQALMVVGGGKELAKAGYRHYKYGFDPKALKSDAAKVGAGILGVEDFVPDYERPAKRRKAAKRNPRPTSAERTDPALWEAVKREVTAGSKGGVRGEWSARKAQLSVALYKKRGGGYLGPKSPQNALAKWTREDWRTRSGDPSLVTGERYLPARAIEALTPAEYAATTRAKRAGLRRDEQFTSQPERIAAKVARYRKNPDLRGSVTSNLRPDTVAVVAFWSPKDSNWLRKQFSDMASAQAFFAKAEQAPAARYVPSQFYVVGE
jgi:hypothetical protein